VTNTVTKTDLSIGQASPLATQDNGNVVRFVRREVSSCKLGRLADVAWRWSQVTRTRCQRKGEGDRRERMFQRWSTLSVIEYVGGATGQCDGLFIAGHVYRFGGDEPQIFEPHVLNGAGRRTDVSGMAGFG
jgi:hypothetical protein